MRLLYLLLAFGLMGSGGYLLYREKEVGAALVGAGVSAVTIQQLEAHKQREWAREQEKEKEKWAKEHIKEQKREESKQQEKERELALIKHLFNQLNKEKEALRNKIEKQNAEISNIKIEKAVLETRLEYAENHQYRITEPDQSVPPKESETPLPLPESDREEFNPQSKAQKEYYVIKVDEDKDNV